MRGRHEDAVAVLRTVATTNGVAMPIYFTRSALDAAAPQGGEEEEEQHGERRVVGGGGGGAGAAGGVRSGRGRAAVASMPLYGHHWTGLSKLASRLVSPHAACSKREPTAL